MAQRGRKRNPDTQFEKIRSLRVCAAAQEAMKPYVKQKGDLKRLVNSALKWACECAAAEKEWITREAAVGCSEKYISTTVYISNEVHVSMKRLCALSDLSMIKGVNTAIVSYLTMPHGRAAAEGNINSIFLSKSSATLANGAS